jgi:hypothetical protein
MASKQQRPLVGSIKAQKTVIANVAHIYDSVPWVPSQRDLAIEIVKELEDRRVLYNDYELEIPHHVVDSVLQMREVLHQKLTYSLAEPIAFRKSHEVPGLQLADVIASAVSYAMRNREDEEANSWLKKIDASHSIEDTILPDFAHADVGRKDGIANSLLLMELVDRAEKGKPLLPGIESLYQRARRELPKILRRKLSLLALLV